MPARKPDDATQVLSDLTGGDASAADRLMPLVYSQLRALAGSFFRGQPADHTIQPTALVHEAFVRMVNQTDVHWRSRAHFYAVAATAMRQILTDYARRRRSAKRGHGWRKVVLDETPGANEQHPIDLIALNEALDRLAELDSRKHRVVELRFFGGLSVEDVAEVMGVSKATVEKDWRAARAWLNRELKDGER